MLILQWTQYKYDTSPSEHTLTCALMDGDFAYCVKKNTTAITGIMAKP